MYIYIYIDENPTAKPNWGITPRARCCCTPHPPVQPPHRAPVSCYSNNGNNQRTYRSSSGRKRSGSSILSGSLGKFGNGSACKAAAETNFPGSVQMSLCRALCRPYAECKIFSQIHFRWFFRFLVVAFGEFIYLCIHLTKNAAWDCFSKAWLFAPVPLDLLVAVQCAGRVYVCASAQLT